MKGGKMSEEPPSNSTNDERPPSPDVQEAPPPYEPDDELITYMEKRRNPDTDN
jgi:hypothetical protein